VKIYSTIVLPTAAHIPSGINRTVATLNALKEKFPDSGIKVTVSEASKDRSIQQNSISHAWYAQAAREGQEYDAGEIKRLCKWHYGIPLLREDEDFNEWCANVLDGMDYEKKVAAMEYITVTSEMTTKQFSAYLEAVQRHFAMKGIELKFPEDY
jgi:hypothetical protein